MRELPKGLVTAHLARQVIRSATSPAANCAEARSAESRRDFVHKMQVCLKELHETSVWLRFVARLGGAEAVGTPEGECDELIAIFVRSINTAKASDLQRRGATSASRSSSSRG
jgi:four helix bundle protein